MGGAKKRAQHKNDGSVGSLFNRRSVKLAVSGRAGPLAASDAATLQGPPRWCGFPCLSSCHSSIEFGNFLCRLHFDAFPVRHASASSSPECPPAMPALAPKHIQVATAKMFAAVSRAPVPLESTKGHEVSSSLGRHFTSSFGAVSQHKADITPPSPKRARSWILPVAEVRADVHYFFMHNNCALICRKRLQPPSQASNN